MTASERYARMAVWAESKADFWSESPRPWALRNMRLYQNYASKYWARHFELAAQENFTSLAEPKAAP